MENYWKTKKWG